MSSVLYVEHGFVDVSRAEDATQALFILAQLLQSKTLEHWHDEVDVNMGYLPLSPAQVRRIAKLLEEAGKPFGVLFTQVPQTQQSALSQGFMVRENPVIRPPRQVVIQKTLPPQSSSKEDLPAQVDDIPEHHAEAFAQALLEDCEPPVITSPPHSIPVSGSPALEEQVQALEGAYESEVLHESEEQMSPALEAFIANQSLAHHELPTKTLKGNLRSGRFESFAGHLVIIGDVHTGAEIRVQGDVLVWGELRGLVHAGFKGSREAEVRSLKLDAVQIRIADVMARRPDRHTQLPSAQEPWKATEGSFFPEIARVVDGEIQLYTTRRHAN
jgi:septum formation inhibitor MinC